MTKILTWKTLRCFFVACSFCLPWQSHCQQGNQTFNVYLGGGISYSVLNYTSGFSGKLGVEAFKTIRIAGNYVHYLRSFEQSSSGNLDKTSYEWDGLFQFMVETSDWAQVYFSAGYNRYHKSLFYPSGREEEVDLNRLKLGSGVQINFMRVSAFGDYHFAVGTENDHLFTMGLLFYLMK